MSLKVASLFLVVDSHNEYSRPLDWNVGNISICILSLLLVVISLWILVFKSNKSTYKYLCWLFITSGLTIIQVILIDAGVLKMYSWLFVFYVPWEFLAPVCFSAFISSYLDRIRIFNNYRNWLLIPFFTFLIIQSVQKINVFLDYSLFSENLSLVISAEWNENLAVLFSLGVGIWNYRMIKSYERSLLEVPYKEVLQQTQWLRRIYTTLIYLSLLWVLIIIYLKVTMFQRSMAAYYPLWLMYLVYYFVFIYVAYNHLKIKDALEIKKQAALQSILTDFKIEGLSQIFEVEELQSFLGNTYDVSSILSYFATSLYDKNNEDQVLWDIVKNAISKLDLEDCVVYMFDKERKVLSQKAAYGNKDKGSSKVLSPIEIIVGNGIVGSVAVSKQWECIHNTEEDSRYVLDDMKRKSELAVPILYKNEILGVLDSEHSQKAFFTKRHIFIFQLIAKLTAIKLKQVSKKGALTITNDNGYFKELSYLVKTEKIYRDPDLSLTSIAERLNISVTYLSQLINKLSGVNFSDYINGYRVRESQKLLIHPNYTSTPILSIGLEAGFNSKSAFYSAFKKYTGITPSIYRAKNPFMS